MSLSVASKRRLEHTPAEASYRTILPLASGGMGSVEVAVKSHGSFERLYAVKRLHPHLAQDENFVSMFFDEARLAGLIRHANVVSVLDLGRDARGPFMAMEYVEGATVRELLQSLARSKELLPIQLSLMIVQQTAAGLQAAHQTTTRSGELINIVHRDVSPHNIIVGFDGITRITDFGIAKALGRSSETMGGVLKGKVGYMSPEQFRFQATDRRSDIFSLGVVLHELLTGKRLYPGNAAESLERVLQEPPPDPCTLRPEVPPSVGALCGRMLSKDPEDRPSSAQQIVEAVSAARESLIAKEGIQDLAAFMDRRFSERRMDMNVALNRALTAVTDVVTGSDHAVKLAPSRRSGTARSVIRVLLIAGAIVALAALAWFAGRMGGEFAKTPDGREDATGKRAPVRTAPDVDELPAGTDDSARGTATSKTAQAEDAVGLEGSPRVTEAQPDPNGGSETGIEVAPAVKRRTPRRTPRETPVERPLTEPPPPIRNRPPTDVGGIPLTPDPGF